MLRKETEMAVSNCPNCGHGSISVIHVCDRCGKRYCSYCNDNNPQRSGNDCPNCGSNSFHDEY